MGVLHCIWLFDLAGLESISILRGKAPSDELIIFGLKDQIIKNYTVDSLKQFAHDIDQVPVPKGLPEDVGKLFANDDLIKIKNKLGLKYPFLKGRNGPTSITEQDQIVNVWWGRQQWGMSIAFNKQIDGPNLIQPNNAIILPVGAYIVFMNKFDD
jgi:hypothetical protein